MLASLIRTASARTLSVVWTCALVLAFAPCSNAEFPWLNSAASRETGTQSTATVLVADLGLSHELFPALWHVPSFDRLPGCQPGNAVPGQFLALDLAPPHCGVPWRSVFHGESLKLQLAQFGTPSPQDLTRPARPTRTSPVAVNAITANAGPPSTVPVGGTAFLDGTQSTSESGQLLTFSWTLLSAPSGSMASIADASAAQTTFSPDKAGDYVVQVTVTDGVHQASAQVTVSTLNSAPAANAGSSQKAVVNSVVTLDGSGSTDPDGDTLSYNWAFVSIPAGSKAQLSDSSEITPTFLVDVPGDYVAKLTVSDGSHSSSATVVVSTNHIPPIADAGPDQTAVIGIPVALDGSASKSTDGAPLQYQWSLTYRPQGSSAALSNAESLSPRFTPDVPGTYAAQLTVTDSEGQSSTATVSVTTGNARPVAIAGPAQSVSRNSLVTLDGSQSFDPDHDALHYAWVLIATPAGSSAALAASTTAGPTFTADLAGDYVAQLIVSDGTLQSAPATVLITATAPQAHVSPQVINFGSQTLQQTSSSKQVTVSNTGTAPLTINTLSLTGTNAAEFNVSSAVPPTTVAPGGNSTVNVTFSPQTIGSKTATLMIANDAGPSTPVVLTGSANPPPAISYSPGNIPFGSQPVGQTTAATTVYISNVGSGTLTISDLSFAGSNPGDFAVSSATLPINVAAGATITVTVTFTPTTTGARSALLLITDNASGSPHMINVSGTGIAPAVTFSPTTINFPNTAVNTTYNSVPLTVTNSGTATLNISGVTFTGTNSGDFSLVSATFPISLKPSASVVLSFAFTPTGSGARVATLNLASNSGNGPNTVTLAGNGIGGGALVSNPTSLSFGSVGTGIAKQLPLQLTNSGTASFAVQSISITGTNAADFTVTYPTLPITLAANSSTSVQVTFNPSATAARSASLVVTYNATGSPLTIPLSGTGVGPSVTFSASTINFGSQPVGTPATPVNLVVTNSGAGVLTITSVTDTGTSASDFGFTLPSGLPITVQPSANISIPVTFTAGAAGTRSATLTFVDNASGSPQTVTLTGTGTVPQITVNPTSITFANTNVGATSSPSTITISNPGTANLQVTGITSSGANPGDFALAPTTFPISIAPNASASISVTFTPTGSGNRSATLSVANSTGTPQTVQLTGSGGSTSSSLTVNPTAINFGTVSTNTTSGAKTVVLSNQGGTNVVISGISLTGPNASEFAATSAPLPLTVSPGGLSTITVTFTPTALGARSATLTITSNAGSPSTVTLSGTGQGTPVASFSSTSITFGNQNVNLTSAPQVLTVNNTGNDNLVISSISLIGTNATEYAFTSATLPITVAPAQSTQIPVTFTPAGNGQRTASLRIVDNAANSPQTIALSGNGTTPILTLSSTSLTFSSVSVGSNGSQTVNMTNSGTGPLTITSLVATGSNAADFSASAGTLPLTIAPQTSSPLTVTFTPAATGSRTATLTVSSNSLGGTPQTISLTGTGVISGPHLNPSVTSLSFGNQPLNTTTASKPVTLTNDGNQDLNITQIAVTGTNASDYNFSGPTLPIKIPASSSVVVQVAFTPSANGARSASLVITDNAPNSPTSIPLSGTGVAPTCTATPSSINFGNQTLNTQSQAQAITVSNTGTAPCVISTVLLSDIQNFGFTLTSGTPVTIAPGSSSQINVTFTPSALVSFTANLTITDNAPNSPAIVSLKGSGVPAGGSGVVSISPNPVSFAKQQLTTSSAPTNVVISNLSGISNVTITALNITGTNPGDFSVSGAPLPITVSPSSTTVLSVIFSPSGVGSRTANLMVTDNATGSPQTVVLNGTGYVNGPSISLPATVNLGNQLVSKSTTQPLVITNPGTQNLVITSLSLQGTNAGDFTLPGLTLPMTVTANGGSQTINLTFTPGAHGARSASLTFVDNSVYPASPQTVALTGFGTQPSITLAPPSIDFGNQQVSTTSSPQTLTIGNTGDGPLIISALVNSSPAIFPATAPALPITVAPGANATVNISFTPSQSGANTGSITLTDNASGSPHTVNLTGNGTVAAIVLPSSPYSVGTQLVQTTSPTVSIPISNSGTAPLVITALSITGTNASEFTLANSLPITIAPNGSGSINLTFTPAAAGTRVANLAITDNAPKSPQTLGLTGTGNVVPVISPTTLPFGSQQAMTTSAPMTITATNGSSNLSLVITSVTITGTNATEFTLGTTPTLPLTIPANSSATFTVSFSPQTTGSKTATLSFVDNFPGSPQAVALTGTATPPPQLVINPSSVTFSTAQALGTAASQPLTLSNTGSATVTVSNIAITGAQSSDFSFTSPQLPLSIPGSGGIASVTVTFTPSATGVRNASLVFTDNAGGHTVPLSGTGKSAPVVSLDKSTISFAPQPVSTSSAASTLMVSNTGNAPLVITGASVTGSNASDFAPTFASQFPITVAPQGSTVISLVFTPSGAGARSATLSLSDNAGDSPQSVTLSGTGTSAVVKLSATTVTFPNQQVNVPSSPATTVTVTNTGTGDLFITAVNLGGTNPGSFSVATAPLPIDVPPNASTTLNITFTPATNNALSAVLSLVDNASNSPQAITLSGTGVVPIITLSPNPLPNFGTVLVGNTVTTPVNVADTGSGALTITGIAISGANPGDFAFTGPTLPITLTPNGTPAQIIVSFTPTTSGARSANLVLTSNTSPQTLQLVGTGNQIPILTFSPTSESFGNQQINQASTPQTLTLSNTGSAPLIISALNITGAQATEFTFPSVSLPLTLQPKATTLLPITFTPTQKGSRTAQLVVTSNDATSPDQLNLTGNGVGLPVFSASSTLNFGSQLLGTSSAATPLSVGNTGTDNLVISAVTISGANAGDFVLSPVNTPVVIASNATTTSSFVLTFTPGGVGSRTATLTFTDNASGSPHTVALTGQGTQPAISVNQTSPINFGNQLKGVASSPTSLVITNSGSANLVVQGLSWAGSNPGDFSVTGSTFPITLAPNAQATLQLTFTPAAIGARSAILSISHNAPGSVLTLTLQGTGVQPIVTLSPATITFPNTPKNTTSAQLPASIQNTGTGPLIITNLVMDGTNASEFSFTSSPLPITVAPGASTTLNVTFTPTDGTPADQPRSANVRITDNAASSPQALYLAGNGTQSTVVINPGSVSFGNVLRNATSSQTVTITNSGAATLNISSFALGGTNPDQFSISAPTTPIALGTNQSTTVSVTFAPTKGGSASATLLINDDSTPNQQTVNLTGTGTAPAFSANQQSLAFGSQLIGTSSPLSITVSNTGNGSLLINNITVTGPNAADFVPPKPTFPVTVGPQLSTPITVTFKPTINGAESATLTLVDNADGSPHSFALTGSGIQPQITLSTQNVTFGQQAVGTTSATQPITIGNTGNGNLIISAISITGTNSGDFAAPGATPITVAPNSTYTLNVSFAPVAGTLGSRTATLSLQDNAPGAPHSVALAGTATQPQITFNGTSNTTTLTFPSINTSTSSTLPLAVGNSGNGNLQITSVTLGGANPGDFSITPPGSYPLSIPAQGSALNFTVTFTPAANGTRTATLVFNDNAPGSPHVLTLTGTGQGPVISVSPNPPANKLDFGTVPVGTTSATKFVNLSNTGNSPLQVTSLSLTGTNPGDFVLQGPSTPFTIQPNQSQNVSVAFQPTTANTVSNATLVIADNAPGSPHSALLTGASGTCNLSLQPISVGQNLETLATVSLTCALPNTLSVTVTSNNPSLVLLSSDTTGMTAGGSSVTVSIPGGQTAAFPGFYVQGLSGTGSASLTASATGMTSVNSSVTLLASGFVLSGGAGAGVPITATVGASDTTLQVSATTLDSSNNPQTTMRVRGGLSVTVPISSSNTGAGTIVGTAVVSGGLINSTGASFHAVGSGQTTLTAQTPSGFSTPASGSQVVATVVAPTITLNSITVGNHLETLGQGTLGAPAPTGGVAVTISSLAPGVAKLSTSPTAAGSSSIILNVAAGASTLPTFYVYGMSIGTTVLQVTATGYAQAACGVPPNPCPGAVAVTPSGFLIAGPSGVAGQALTTTTASSSSQLTVMAERLDASGNPATTGIIQGGLTVNVTVLSSNTSVGTIQSPTVVFAGGTSSVSTASFQPAGQGSTTLSINSSGTPGFSTPTSGGTIAVTVTQPQIVFSLPTTNVGVNLQLDSSAKLTAGAPSGGLTVTISSNNPQVVISGDPTAQGSSSIPLTVAAGAGLDGVGFPPFYVQVLPGNSGGTAVITASAPGYATATVTLNITPSAFTLTSVNGLGADFGISSSQESSQLTLTAMQLNSSFAPQQQQSVRGGLSLLVTINSSVPNIGVVTESPVAFSGGISSQPVHFTWSMKQTGTTLLSIQAPAGFSTASVGGSLHATVN